jgi:uncharacterized phage-like protein YoqJ
VANPDDRTEAFDSPAGSFKPGVPGDSFKPGVPDGAFKPSVPGTDREATCCFTGHRRIPPERLAHVEEKTSHVLDVLIRAGFRWFLAGGALGYDTLAENIVLSKREANPDIRLILALPCRDQTNMWLRLPKEHQNECLREYQRLKGLADEVVYVNDFYFDGCMRERNLYMVERSSFCVACFDGSLRSRSGAGQTFRMARRAGLKIYNCWE